MSYKCASKGCPCMIAVGMPLCDACDRRLKDCYHACCDEPTIRIHAEGLSVTLTEPRATLFADYIALRAADVQVFFDIGPDSAWTRGTDDALVIMI